MLDWLKRRSRSDDPGARPEEGELDALLARGLAWTGGSKWTIQLLNWSSTVVVARILTPEDYGLLGMAFIFVGFVDLISEFGIGAALVQKPDLEKAEAAKLGGASITFGALLMLVTIAGSGLVASFFDQRAVQWILIALSTTFVIRGISVLPRSLMQREMRFRELAIVDALRSLAIVTVTITSALAGLRYWSLVLGNIMGSITATLVLAVLRPHPYALPRPFAEVRQSLGFGGRVVGSRIAGYVYSKADFAIVGRIMGPDPLGWYNFAWSIASAPVEQISALISKVAPGLLASVQDQPAALRRYIRRLSGGIALLAFPAAAGLALVADDLVFTLLGDQWGPTILPLRMLAVVAGLRSVVAVTSQVLVAIGEVHILLEDSIVMALIVPTSCLVGAMYYGLPGVALGWVVGHPLATIPFYVRHTLQCTDMSWRQYLGAFWPSFSSMTVMVGAVLLVRTLLPVTAPDILRLVVQIATGVATYSAMIFILHRSTVASVKEQLALLRSDG